MHPNRARAPSLSASRVGVYPWVLVLALLWAQSLGLWHGIVHAGHGLDSTHATLALTNSLSDVAPSAAGASSPHSLFESLFGNHHEGVDCELFDQLCHGHALATALVLVLPLGVPAAHTAYLTGLAVARWAALFQARAPPFSR